MRYAETGFDLEIDLSRGNIERVQNDPELTRLHLGGQGTAAKILWDRVPPETDPFSPSNLLIFSAGLLHGTPVPGANRTSISTINPQQRPQNFMRIQSAIHIRQIVSQVKTHHISTFDINSATSFKILPQ